MRWPFGRRDRAQKETPPEATPSAVRPEDPPPPKDEHWRSAEPIKRVLRPAPVSRALDFASVVRAGRAPDLTLAPLTHSRSPAASPGIASGLVHRSPERTQDPPVGAPGSPARLVPVSDGSRPADKPLPRPAPPPVDRQARAESPPPLPTADERPTRRLAAADPPSPAPVPPPTAAPQGPLPPMPERVARPVQRPVVHRAAARAPDVRPTVAAPRPAPAATPGAAPRPESPVSARAHPEPPPARTLVPTPAQPPVIARAPASPESPAAASPPPRPRRIVGPPIERAPVAALRPTDETRGDITATADSPRTLPVRPDTPPPRPDARDETAPAPRAPVVVQRTASGPLVRPRRVRAAQDTPVPPPVVNRRVTTAPLVGRHVGAAVHREPTEPERGAEAVTAGVRHDRDGPAISAPVARPVREALSRPDAPARPRQQQVPLQLASRPSASAAVMRAAERAPAPPAAQASPAASPTPAAHAPPRTPAAPLPARPHAPVVHRAPEDVRAPAPVRSRDEDQNLDLLARRLYTRIRARLKADLLVDRERAGIAVDAR